jgi:hypothetical protein
VTKITAQSDTGATGLNAGHTVTITVDTSEPVLVSGNPTLTLNNSATAEFTAGSGSNSLKFTYTVQAGQDSPDLQVTDPRFRMGQQFRTRQVLPSPEQ